MRWEEKVSMLLDNTAKSAIDIKETKIGLVTSLEPLQIEIGELVLNKENLYINEDLLKCERVFTIPVQSASGSTTAPASITKCGFSNSKIIFESRLKIGDLVALRKLEFEKYYVENKIIKGSDI
ncbi:MAG: DUF2577 domain-containing protein [Clostridium butyricum]|nr:DUF2577 domain-containing protein [Clostridium butyricum]